MPGRYIAVGLYSGVAVKRGSTVSHITLNALYTVGHASTILITSPVVQQHGYTCLLWILFQFAVI